VFTPLKHPGAGLQVEKFRAVCVYFGLYLLSAGFDFKTAGGKGIVSRAIPESSGFRALRKMMPNEICMNRLHALGVGECLPNHLLLSHCKLSVILAIVSLVVWSLFIKKLAGVGKYLNTPFFMEENMNGMAAVKLIL